tara:strand:+ start:309 stop:791 length:483 start_codon:yes stop_codon:yes gene_type:complete
MGKLYFSYGSNLNVSQMATRCPNAIQLGSTYLPNWRLVFRGVADIEPSRNVDDLLPVGVWEITDECEKSLDIYEGFPRLYGKTHVIGMMTYTMNTKSIAPPSRGYFNSILEGYKDFGLNTNHLYEALGWSHYQSKQYDWSTSKSKFKPSFIRYKEANFTS